jgi:hypothetical protein
VKAGLKGSGGYVRSEKEIIEHIKLMKTREIPTWVYRDSLNYDAILDDLLDFAKWLLEIEDTGQ